MNGVEILSSETIYNTILPEYFIAIGLIVGLAFVAAMTACFAGDRIIAGLICIVLALGSGIVGSLGGTYSKTDISHIEYKVIIDDSVSMNEFLDKYKIIDQEGKIYTVKERE
jgi:hypothetical protein